MLYVTHFGLYLKKNEEGGNVGYINFLLKSYQPNCLLASGSSLIYCFYSRMALVDVHFLSFHMCLDDYQRGGICFF